MEACMIDGIQPIMESPKSFSRAIHIEIPVAMESADERSYSHTHKRATHSRKSS